jgi:hypothetical protein
MKKTLKQFCDDYFVFIKILFITLVCLSLFFHMWITLCGVALVMSLVLRSRASSKNLGEFSNTFLILCFIVPLIILAVFPILYPKISLIDGLSSLVSNPIFVLVLWVVWVWRTYRNEHAKCH